MTEAYVLSGACKAFCNHKAYKERESRIPRFSSTLRDAQGEGCIHKEYLQEPGLPQTISVQARHRTHPPRKEAGRTSSQWFFQKSALAGEPRAAGGRTQQEKLFFSPAHTETCRLGAACLPLLYSFRHFCMCTQSTLSSPVCLPEGPVQLLQLWTQGKLHSQVHAESFKPLLQSTEGRPGEKKQKNLSFA